MEGRVKMNILHYSLGFPPFRRGGMTKYCIDLMKYQVKYGNKVGLLWPGKILKNTNLINIKKRKSYSNFDKTLNIDSYEIINSMPVPLLDGIKETEVFTEKRDNSYVVNWLKTQSIDVIHIHTLMGLPSEFLDAAKICGIKLIFTTHDYFGLCPKCNFTNGIKLCNTAKECIDCAECNETALSLKKIKFMQSYTYKYIKEMKFVKVLRKQHIKLINKKYRNNNKINNLKKYTYDEVYRYINLRDYYIKMLLKIDKIHFNSKNTMKIYNQYFNFENKGEVISISHENIHNNKRNKIYSNKVRFSYLGPLSVRKGFFELKKVLDNLYNKGIKNFELNIYSKLDNKTPYIISNNEYKYSDLDSVMDKTDILIVPSICNETFGFTLLEALSYGVPVIASNMVGAKDLVEQYKSGLIYNNIEQLEFELENILRNPQEILSKMNSYIIKKVDIKDMSNHSKEIINLYKNIRSVL